MKPGAQRQSRHGGVQQLMLGGGGTNPNSSPPPPKRRSLPDSLFLPPFGRGPYSGVGRESSRDSPSSRHHSPSTQPPNLTFYSTPSALLLSLGWAAITKRPERLKPLRATPFIFVFSVTRSRGKSKFKAHKWRMRKLKTMTHKPGLFGLQNSAPGKLTGSPCRPRTEGTARGWESPGLGRALGLTRVSGAFGLPAPTGFRGSRRPRSPEGLRLGPRPPR